jgi:protease I
MADLSGKKVAIVVDDYFEQAEFIGPRDALHEAGADVTVISTEGGEIHGLNHIDPSDTFQADMSTAEADPGDYDALVLPGGVVNADNLRMDEDVRFWVQDYMVTEKPVAAICHAPWILASADVVSGRTLTSWPTLQDDMRNAGAKWVDEEVCVDGNLITSRKPDDIPAFNREIIKALENSGGPEEE